jgi:hypothetical protein
MGHRPARRSLIELLGTIETLKGCSVDLYLDQQNLDTTPPPLVG